MLLERHDEILKILSNRGKVSVQEFTGRLGVSEVTIRKDLSILEETGFLIRTRGGATLAADKDLIRPITVRRKEHLEEKKAIARKAREFIQEGDTIYLDSGSTAVSLAALIKDMSLRVVTNSVDIVLALADAPEHRGLLHRRKLQKGRGILYRSHDHRSLKGVPDRYGLHRRHRLFFGRPFQLAEPLESEVKKTSTSDRSEKNYAGGQLEIRDFRLFGLRQA